MGDHQDHLTAEAKSWIIEDPVARAEKFQRERIRHHGMVRALLLDQLDTTQMDVLEIGGGPMPLSDLLSFRTRVVVDPLTADYSTVLPCPDHVALAAEDMSITDGFDLAIATNSLDHVHNPERALANTDRALRSGGFMAILCAENNALTNPHPAHEHNLTAAWVHDRLDEDYETVWQLTYADNGFRYGWVPYAGKRGQPAFALLMRKCSGYSA